MRHAEAGLAAVDAAHVLIDEFRFITGGLNTGWCFDQDRHDSIFIFAASDMISNWNSMRHAIVAFVLSCSLLPAAERVSVPIENDQVRVVDVTVQPREKTRLHEHKMNRVMIYLDKGSQHFEYHGKGLRRSLLACRGAKMESRSRHAHSGDHE